MTGDAIVDKVLIGVALAIVTACVGLFVRVRQLEAKRLLADDRLNKLEKRDVSAAVSGVGEQLDAFRKDFHAHQLESERRFVDRDDWVPTMSRMLGHQEQQIRAISRIEEWIRIKDQ